MKRILAENTPLPEIYFECEVLNAIPNVSLNPFDYISLLLNKTKDEKRFHDSKLKYVMALTFR